MTNKDKADRIKNMIGEDKDHGRPADILADLMHYCKIYPDIEDSEIFHDFEYELNIARGYFDEEDEDWQDEKKQEVADFFGGVVNDKR